MFIFYPTERKKGKDRLPLPVTDKLVHSMDEIFFLLCHVYELPLNTAYFCQNHERKRDNH